MDRRQPPPPSSRSRMRYIQIIMLMDDSIYNYNNTWLLGELERKICFLFFSTVSSQNASQKTMPNNTTKAGVVVETMSAPNPVSKFDLNKYILIRNIRYHSQSYVYVQLIVYIISVLSKHAWNLLFDGTDKSRTYTSCDWLHHCVATSGASICMVSTRIELIH